MLLVEFAQVPSAYFLTDVFLELDGLLDHRVYIEDPENGRGSRVSQAAGDAQRAKKCCGAIRYLWRNTKKGSHDESIQEIKELLQESPTQKRNGKKPEALRDQESDEASDGEEECSEPEALQATDGSDGSDGARTPTSQASTLAMGGGKLADVTGPQEVSASESEEVAQEADEKPETPLVEKWVAEIKGLLSQEPGIRELLGFT